MNDLPALRRRADKLLAEYRLARQTAKREAAELKRLRRHEADVLEAQKVLQTVAQTVQQAAHRQISSLVTKCLRTVLGPEYEFKVLFEQKRGKTEARLAFFESGKEVHPSMGSGGGMLDVAAFALRLACIMLKKPPARRLVVADEPFRHLNGPEEQERAGRLLAALAEELGFQFVIASDDDWLASAGKVVDLSRKRVVQSPGGAGGSAPKPEREGKRWRRRRR